ncbi:hypothetical protein LUZ60_002121 [Juncus effusus]|nr:hypothetical protein LUZ60_002121 [Juncus effusus]
MEVGGNLLDPSAQEFYPSLSSPVPPVPVLPPPFPPPFPPQFYYPPVPAPPPAEYVRPAWITDDALPTRGVVLSMVPRHVSESDVVSSLECFGSVRAVDMTELVTDGIVTVHFYDLRSAQAAVHEVREEHVRQQSRMGQLYGLPVPVPMMAAPWDWPETGAVGTARGSVCGHAVWANFAVARPEESNQGTIVVISPLPPGVSVHALRETFESFGSVKEVRESAMKPYNKFVEFFDTRDATRALRELNGKEVFGRRLVLEYTRPAASHARSNKCNVGYGFVNLTSPQAAFRLYKAFHKQPWEVFNSRKICQVTYARLQGLEALKEHFKNSKFACDKDEYMPVEFSPPRDGVQKTEPTTIGGRESPLPDSSLPKSVGSDGGETSSTNASMRASSDQDETEETYGCAETSSRLDLLGIEDQGYSD